MLVCLVSTLRCFVLIAQSIRYDHGLAGNGRTANDSCTTWRRPLEILPLGLERRQAGRSHPISTDGL